MKSLLTSTIVVTFAVSKLFAQDISGTWHGILTLEWQRSDWEAKDFAERHILTNDALPS
jgi:hypothetical protein